MPASSGARPSSAANASSSGGFDAGVDVEIDIRGDRRRIGRCRSVRHSRLCDADPVHRTFRRPRSYRSLSETPTRAQRLPPGDRNLGHRIDSQARRWPTPPPGCLRKPSGVHDAPHSIPLRPGCRGAPPHVGGYGVGCAGRRRDLDVADVRLQRLLGRNGVAVEPGGHADRCRSGASRPGSPAQRSQLALFRGRHSVPGRSLRVRRGRSESARPGDRRLRDPPLPRRRRCRSSSRTARTPPPRPLP